MDEAQEARMMRVLHRLERDFEIRDREEQEVWPRLGTLRRFGEFLAADLRRQGRAFFDAPDSTASIPPSPSIYLQLGVAAVAAVADGGEFMAANGNADAAQIERQYRRLFEHPRARKQVFGPRRKPLITTSPEVSKVVTYLAHDRQAVEALQSGDFVNLTPAERQGWERHVAGERTTGAADRQARSRARRKVEAAVLRAANVTT